MGKLAFQHLGWSFVDLDETAQEKVLDRFRDINVDSDWWHECAIDTIKEAGRLLGIEIENVYFSGFWNQGDGACFTGSYEYRKGATKAIKQEFPVTAENQFWRSLHVVADDLQDIQRRSFYGLSATVKHTDRYSHEYSVTIDVERRDRNGWYMTATEDENDALAEVLRDFMRWSYRYLEAEYEYLTSREAIIETIEANEYVFNSDGTLA